MNPSVILVVDDQREMCELLETAFRLKGYQVIWRQNAAEALDVVQKSDVDVVVTDVKMPGTSGLELCHELNSIRPDIPVVVMTAFGNLETAVAAMRSGAYDFVVKPIEMDMLDITVRRAVERRQLSKQIRLLTDAPELSGHWGRLIGESAPMRQLIDQLQLISESEASVLITGESGTGKELVAKSLHEHSHRAKGPFVAFNCAALSETLLESELFGHVRGAFTDARTERKGLFLEAEKGTLLLDEIGDMPMSMQVKLLRALEERKLRPVGSDREVGFDVRVLASTHRDLESSVEEGKFRQDLYYRINVIQAHLPPLRSRGTDVLILARHFVRQFASKSNKAITGFDDAVAERLLTYNWPGNIRELRNVMERAVALARRTSLTVEDLPEKIQKHKSATVFIGGDDPTELVPLEEIERRYIEHVLKAVDNNRSQASKILGVDRKTLYRKLKEEG